MTTSFSNTYVGREDVTVPAGTFSAYKIQSRQVFTYSQDPKRNGSASVTYWYVPQVRAMVRTERRVFDGQENNVMLLTEELTSYADK